MEGGGKNCCLQLWTSVPDVVLQGAMASAKAFLCEYCPNTTPGQRRGEGEEKKRGEKVKLECKGPLHEEPPEYVTHTSAEHSEVVPKGEETGQGRWEAGVTSREEKEGQLKWGRKSVRNK